MRKVRIHIPTTTMDGEVLSELVTGISSETQLGGGFKKVLFTLTWGILGK